MLQIHDVLESLKDHEKNNLWEDKHFIKDTITDFIKGGVACFDFGNLKDIDEKTWDSLYEYATDLIKNDMFRLPYSNVYYSYILDEPHGILLEQTKSREIEMFIVVASKKSKYVGALIFGSAEFLENDNNYGKRFGIRHKMLFQHPLVETLVDNADVAAIDESTRSVLVLTSLLQSRHVKTREHALAPRQNAKRVKRGLLPIMPYHTVYFDVDGKSYNTDGSLRGGTHASPRMHWRRGHVRNMASGKLVHVRPHLVCAGVDEDVHVPKPQYQLRTGK